MTCMARQNGVYLYPWVLILMMFTASETEATLFAHVGSKDVNVADFGNTFNIPVTLFQESSTNIRSFNFTFDLDQDSLFTGFSVPNGLTFVGFADPAISNTATFGPPQLVDIQLAGDADTSVAVPDPAGLLLFNLQFQVNAPLQKGDKIVVKLVHTTPVDLLEIQDANGIADLTITNGSITIVPESSSFLLLSFVGVVGGLVRLICNRLFC